LRPEQIRVHRQHAGIDAEIDPLDARRIAGGGKRKGQWQEVFAGRVRARRIGRLLQPARQSDLVAGPQTGVDPTAEFIDVRKRVCLPGYEAMAARVLNPFAEVVGHVA